jgi:Putative transposase
VRAQACSPCSMSALRLKTPWHDGTTHVLFEHIDFVAKLAALVSRPRKNLVLYHGVLTKRLPATALDIPKLALQLLPVSRGSTQ